MIFLVVTSNDLCSRKKKPKKQKPEQDALEPAILKTKFKWRWTGGALASLSGLDLENGIPGGRGSRSRGQTDAGKELLAPSGGRYQ